MQFKTAPTQVKNVDPETGVFEAYVAIFDNRDSYGDIMRKGSFEQTLSDWRTKDAPIPVLWSHRTDDPDMNLGHVLEAKETDRGLWIKAQLDLESPKARTVHRLMKGGRVREFSFAYEVLDGGVGTKDGETFYEVRSVKLHEVGPTPIGANPQTELLDVKAAAEEIQVHIKAGRVLSAKNDTIVREVITELESAAVALKSVLPDEKADEVRDETSDEKEPPASDEKSSPAVATPSPPVRLALAEAEIQIAEGDI
jgi:uncharacterized protein